DNSILLELSRPLREKYNVWKSDIRIIIRQKVDMSDKLFSIWILLNDKLGDEKRGLLSQIEPLKERQKNRKIKFFDKHIQKGSSKEDAESYWNNFDSEPNVADIICHLLEVIKEVRDITYV